MSISKRTEPVFDESVLREITSAAGMAPWELIELFLQDAGQSVATIEQSRATADFDSINRATHMLKSSAGSVGAMCIAAIARELDAATKPTQAVIDPEACATLSDQLRQAFDEFVRQAETDRERLSA